MSDARWADVNASAESATKHFRSSLELFALGGFDAPGLDGYRASMAIMHSMHAAHTSAEAALKRVLDILGEERPSGEDWHETLINRLASSLTGAHMRPAVLPRELAAALHMTRQFRHVAAHAYDRFDASRAAPAIRAAAYVAEHLLPAIDRFKAVVDPEPA